MKPEELKQRIEAMEPKCPKCDAQQSTAYLEVLMDVLEYKLRCTCGCVRHWQITEEAAAACKDPDLAIAYHFYGWFPHWEVRRKDAGKTLLLKECAKLNGEIAELKRQLKDGGWSDTKERIRAERELEDTRREVITLKERSHQAESAARAWERSAREYQAENAELKRKLERMSTVLTQDGEWKNVSMGTPVPPESTVDAIYSAWPWPKRSIKKAESIKLLNEDLKAGKMVVGVDVAKPVCDSDRVTGVYVLDVWKRRDKSETLRPGCIMDACWNERDTGSRLCEKHASTGDKSEKNRCECGVFIPATHTRCVDCAHVAHQRHLAFVPAGDKSDGRERLASWAARGGKELSPEAQEARRPPPPESLVDARQDIVHKSVGKGRPAKTVRRDKSETRISEWGPRLLSEIAKCPFCRKPAKATARDNGEGYPSATIEACCVDTAKRWSAARCTLLLNNDKGTTRRRLQRPQFGALAGWFDDYGEHCEGMHRWSDKSETLCGLPVAPDDGALTIGKLREGAKRGFSFREPTKAGDKSETPEERYAPNEDGGPGYDDDLPEDEPHLIPHQPPATLYKCPRCQGYNVYVAGEVCGACMIAKAGRQGGKGQDVRKLFESEMRRPMPAASANKPLGPAIEELKEIESRRWSKRLREKLAESEAKKAADTATPWDPEGGE